MKFIHFRRPKWPIKLAFTCWLSHSSLVVFPFLLMKLQFLGDWTITISAAFFTHTVYLNTQYLGDVPIFCCLISQIYFVGYLLWPRYVPSQGLPLGLTLEPLIFFFIISRWNGNFWAIFRPKLDSWLYLPPYPKSYPKSYPNKSPLQSQ